MFFSTTILLTAFFTSPVWARPNMARCASGFEWNKNTRGQDPCTVGSILDASCRGLTEYAFLPLTNNTQYYLPPRANHSGDLTCDCNTVMYSLYMACASCQGGQIYPWEQWIPKCAGVYVSQYPADIPRGTTIPRWAYYNVTSLPNQTWNESVVMSDGWNHEILLRRVDTTQPSAPPPITPSLMTSTGTPPIPVTKTTISSDTPTPRPLKVTSTKNGDPYPTIPNDPTVSPEPSDPTGTMTSPGPTDPTGTTSSPGPTDPTGNMDPPESTTPAGGNTNSPRTSNRTSNTSSPRPTNRTSNTNPTGSNTSLPTPTNASGKKGGMNVWATVVLFFLWALV